MSARFDPMALERELLGAGLAHANAGGSVIGCRSGTRHDQDGRDDVTQIIDWTPGHPTPAERAVAVSVLAVHDRERRKREQEQRRTRLAEIERKITAGMVTDVEVREHLRLGIEYRENGLAVT
jgi:hypothetical protein